MTRFKAALIVISLVLLWTAGPAHALPLNTRPVLGVTASDLANLDSILNDITTGMGWGIDVINDQSPAAIFTPKQSMGGYDTVAALIFEGADYASTNIFGIYSANDPSKKLQIFAGADSPWDAKMVVWNAAGDVTISGEPGSTITGFGHNFGFYLGTLGSPTGYWYSEDDKNGASPVAQMLIYQDPSIPTDWVVGCEDLDRAAGAADNDFDDLVVYVESANGPIPEPATLILVGGGLLGLAGFRRKFKK